MSTSDQVRAILAGARRAYEAEPAYRQRPDVFHELNRIAARLNQQIRIVLAGTLKTGKSTLVNALVGESIAPTDATEATRLVTWFRHAPHRRSPPTTLAAGAPTCRSCAGRTTERA